MWAVASGAAVPVVLARVTVQRSDGASFEVAVEEGKSRVSEVKHEVEMVEGVSASLCDLFLLSDEGDSGDSGGPLSDDAKVEDGWLLALVVRGTQQHTSCCRNILDTYYRHHQSWGQLPKIQLTLHLFSLIYQRSTRQTTQKASHLNFLSLLEV